METQRQWSDKAIERTTPVILASFSIITLMGLGLSKAKDENISVQQTSWYKKDHLTFSDILAYVREPVAREKLKSLVGKKAKWRKTNLENLIYEMIAA